MSFGEAIKSVFSKYATFSGRARRSEYWYFVLFNVLFMLGFALIARVFPEAKFLTYLYLVYSLAIVIPSLAVGVRRLHDIGKRGWNMFILLIVALLNSSITVLGKSSLKIGSGVLLILAIIADLCQRPVIFFILLHLSIKIKHLSLPFEINLKTY